jgi:hypothetical protein
MNPGYEESFYDQDGFTRLDKHRFIGYSISCDYERTVKIKIFAEDEYRECDLGTVSLVNAIRDSEWIYGPDRFSELRERIDAVFIEE